MRALRAAWAEWTCEDPSKEVSIRRITADTLDITVKGARAGFDAGADPESRGTKTPYSAHSSQAPQVRGLFFSGARTPTKRMRGATRPLSSGYFPPSPAGFIVPFEEAPRWLISLAPGCWRPPAARS